MIVFRHRGCSSRHDSPWGIRPTPLHATPLSNILLSSSPATTSLCHMATFLSKKNFLSNVTFLSVFLALVGCFFVEPLFERCVRWALFLVFFEHSKKHSRYCGTFMGKWLTCKFANNYQNRGYNRTNHVSWHPVYLCHKMYVSISWEIEFLSPPIKIQFCDAETFTVQKFSCHCQSDKYERSLSNMKSTLAKGIKPNENMAKGKSQVSTTAM